MLRRQEDLQVVISDWMMPLMDGIDLCPGSGLAAASGIPAYGADDFIPKPLDPEELIARLRVADRILGLQAEMKQLQGLLSICSCCKNIREGRDRWVPVEQYVSRRADTLSSLTGSVRALPRSTSPSSLAVPSPRPSSWTVLEAAHGAVA